MLAVGAQPGGDAGGAELSSLSVIGWRSELSLSVMLAGGAQPVGDAGGAELRLSVMLAVRSSACR